VLGLRVTITRYTDRDGNPPLVEAQFVDADGRLWCFIDKEPIFLDGEVTPPAAGILRCSLLPEQQPAPDEAIVTITTLYPDHVEALEDGQTTFRVDIKQLVELSE
jgi:hypothetical protein